MDEIEVHNNSTTSNLYYYIFGGLGALLVVLYACFVSWGIETFGITIKEILYTIAAPMKGADTNFLKQIALYCLFPVFIFLCCWIAFCLCHKKYGEAFRIKFSTTKKEINLNGFSVIKKVISALLILAVILTTVRADYEFKIIEYIKFLLS